MSYWVTKLVRCIRLPRTMKHRPVAKGVLLSLADDCHDVTLCAFTSRTTIAREVEISPDTVDAHLQALRAHGLISKVAGYRQHRPNTWSPQLPAIAALADPVAVAKLKPEEQAIIADLQGQHHPLQAQHRSTSAQPAPEPDPTLADSALEPDPTLEPLDGRESDHSASDHVPTLKHTASEFSNPALEILPSAWDRVPTERYLNGTENKDRTLAPTPSSTRQAKEPNGTNFKVIRRIAIELLKAGSRLPWADLVEAVKQECANRQIDYGRHDQVPFRVVHQACASAEFDVFVKPKLGMPSDDTADKPATRKAIAR